MSIPVSWYHRPIFSLKYLHKIYKQCKPLLKLNTYLPLKLVPIPVSWYHRPIFSLKYLHKIYKQCKTFGINKYLFTKDTCADTGFMVSQTNLQLKILAQDIQTMQTFAINEYPFTNETCADTSFMVSQTNLQLKILAQDIQTMQTFAINDSYLPMKLVPITTISFPSAKESIKQEYRK